jgi:diketogulonate reductase-like aldo/keto reductase
MGGGTWSPDTSRDAEDVAAIQLAISSGITHIDTAENYGGGHSEELLGHAIKDFDRNKLRIATKVSAAHQSYDELLRSFESSTNRIGTDYIDIYLLHSYPKPGIDIRETMRALDRLVDEGVVKNIGVCNLTPKRFEIAQSYTKHKIVCNQVHYNLQYREVEDKGVLTQAQKTDTMIVAWRPIQAGVLPDSKLLDKLVKKYSKSKIQLALNWLVSQKNVVTISKTSSREHLQENLGALNWSMEQDDIELLRREFPDQKLVSDSVPLDYEGSDAP